MRYRDEEGTVRINDVITEVLDAIGDDEEYVAGRAELLLAEQALRTGTTAEARSHLDRAQALIDEACPL